MTCGNYRTSFYFLPPNILTHCVVMLHRIVDSVRWKEQGSQVFSDGIDPLAQAGTREEVEDKKITDSLWTLKMLFNKNDQATQQLKTLQESFFRDSNPERNNLFLWALTSSHWLTRVGGNLRRIQDGGKIPQICIGWGWTEIRNQMRRTGKQKLCSSSHPPGQVRSGLE